MNAGEQAVSTVDELVAATRDTGVRRIIVRGDVASAPSVRLAPGQTLQGDDDGAGITFAERTDGLQLSSDNRIHHLRLHASPDKRAIFNDTAVETLGRLELVGVATTGRVQILARDEVRGGHVEVVRRGIETFGGSGPSLVKGVVTTLSAIGLSVKPGGSAREIDISGGIKTHGAGVPPSSNMARSSRFGLSGGAWRRAEASTQSSVAACPSRYP